VKALRKKALGILEAAEEAGDLKTALLGINEARELHGTLGQVRRPAERPTSNQLRSQC